MTLELTALALASALGFCHIILASHSSNFQRGYRWAAGTRDDLVAPLTGLAGRLERASRNYLETFPFFAAGILTVAVTESGGTITLWACWTYLAARVIYLAAYARGLGLVRSLIWNVGTFSIAAILVAPFL